MATEWDAFPQATQSSGASEWDAFPTAGKSAAPAGRPVKIGQDAFADTLRSELQNTDWLTRNIAGAGSAVVNAWEGIKGLAGQTDARQVANQNIIADEAPVGNIAGNIAMLAPTMAIPGAATVRGAALIGAGQGAALTPGSLKDRIEAAGFGMAGGAAGAGIGRALGSAAPIVRNADADALAAQGVRLTPGQNAGGFLKAMEDKATSIPFLGDVINSARRGGLEDFNRAAIKRATLPGQQIDDIGRDGVAALRQQLGQAYDDVLSRSTVNATDPQFVQNVANLRSMAQNLPEREARAFDQLIAREIEPRMAPGGQINAENLQAVKSAIGQNVSDFSTSTDAYQRQLGQAMKQLQAEFTDLVRRANPQNADDLKAIDAAYANFKRIQRAASGVGAQDGIFTPAQLKSAAKALDKTKDKRGFSEGTALLQDLAEAGQSVLPSKVPDSGTAGRLAGNLTSLGGLLSSGLGAAASLPALVAYSRPGAAAINAGINRGAIPLAELLRQMGGNRTASTLGGMALGNHAGQ